MSGRDLRAITSKESRFLAKVSMGTLWGSISSALMARATKVSASTDRFSNSNCLSVVGDHWVSTLVACFLFPSSINVEPMMREIWLLSAREENGGTQSRIKNGFSLGLHIVGTGDMGLDEADGYRNF